MEGFNGDHRRGSAAAGARSSRGAAPRLPPPAACNQTGVRFLRRFRRSRQGEAAGATGPSARGGPAERGSRCGRGGRAGPGAPRQGRGWGGSRAVQGSLPGPGLGAQPPGRRQGPIERTWVRCAGRGREGPGCREPCWAVLGSCSDCCPGVRTRIRSCSFSVPPPPQDTMSSGNDRHPQAFTKPALAEGEVAALVDRVFGLKVSWVRPLPSYDDQNFHVRVLRSEGADGGADEYVLKVTNSEDSQQPDLIEVQTQAMMFLSTKGFPSATPYLTKGGDIMSLESGGGPGNKKYLVRLLTYLPGTPVAKVATTPQVFYEIGKLAASLDTALAEKFHHPSVKSLHRGQFIWNLANVPLLDQYIYALGENKYRELVEQVIEQFKGEVVPKLSSFRACINHGDLNDHNILVEPSSPEHPPQYRVSGILDFSDMSYGYYVFEVAIAIMYMMIESSDPLRVGGHILAGFESVLPLTAAERGALFLLVSGRFAQSLVMAAHTALLYPDNVEYLMVTARSGWRHLTSMFEMGQEAVEKMWFETAAAYGHQAPAESRHGDTRRVQ